MIIKTIALIILNYFLFQPTICQETLTASYSQLYFGGSLSRLNDFQLNGVRMMLELYAKGTNHPDTLTVECVVTKQEMVRRRRQRPRVMNAALRLRRYRSQRSSRAQQIRVSATNTRSLFAQENMTPRNLMECSNHNDASMTVRFDVTWSTTDENEDLNCYKYNFESWMNSIKGRNINVNDLRLLEICANAVRNLHSSDEPALPPSSCLTEAPSMAPSVGEGEKTDRPTYGGDQSQAPTSKPTGDPSMGPTKAASEFPSRRPSFIETFKPSSSPKPSFVVPTGKPTGADDTKAPSTMPSTVEPTDGPTDIPTTTPSKMPTTFPSIAHSTFPTGTPTDWPSTIPSAVPSAVSSENPTGDGSDAPSELPSDITSELPSISPSSSMTPSTISPTLSIRPSLTSKPSRTPVEDTVRTDDVARVIMKVSDTSDEDSCQYKSLQWILNDDTIDPPLFSDETTRIYQRYGLKTIHCLLNGEGWKDDANWGTGSQECEWFGVGCDDQGNMKDLNLNGNALSGDFPEEFGLLTTLEKLDLGSNSIQSFVPFSLGKLTGLTVLNVARNKISGELPDAIGLLTKLTSFSIYDNSIGGIMPPSICNIKIEYIAADCNDLYCSCCTDCCDQIECDSTTAPTVSFKLPFGTDKPTSSNSFIGMPEYTDPPTIAFKVPTATIAPTSAAPLSSLPTATSSPTVFVIPPTASIAPITLSPANIDTITNSISSVSDISDTESSQYKALQWVINDVHFSSDLDVYTRYALMTIYYSLDGDSWTDNSKWGKSVTECYWHGMECDDDGNVVTLDLQKNGLSGGIPPEIGLLKTLGKIDFNGNSLTGTMTAKLTDLENLTSLDVANNYLSGTISAVATITSLEHLVLSNNQFSGSIEESFGQLSDLITFKVSINLLSGTIPDSLSSLTKLKTFTFDNNYFSGIMPDSMCNSDPEFFQADCNEVVCSCCTHCCAEYVGCVTYDEFWGNGGGNDGYMYY